MQKMNEFFAAGVNGYDEHILENVSGCKDAYIEISKHIPNEASKLLDLGCGTGLHLEHIFAKNPTISITGIDLTKEMLDRLLDKYKGKNINLICGSNCITIILTTFLNFRYINLFITNSTPKHDKIYQMGKS